MITPLEILAEAAWSIFQTLVAFILLVFLLFLISLLFPMKIFVWILVLGILGGIGYLFVLALREGTAPSSYGIERLSVPSAEKPVDSYKAPARDLPCQYHSPRQDLDANVHISVTIRFPESWAITDITITQQ